jgi:hypothetical protein
MLNIDRLLKLASGAQVEPDPTDPTRPDHEKRKSGQQNLGGPGANPTDPTDPTKKTAVATTQGAGAETPPSRAAEGLLHPRDCPQWWQGCLAGCGWYHPDGGDFCWKVIRAWWEEPYQGGDE